MKQVILSVFFLSAGLAFAQEIIAPLKTNPSIYKEVLQTRASTLNILDSTFVYEFANIDLRHVQDDFSTDKFEQFDGDFDEAGVTSVLYHHLMDETNTTPLDGSLFFCDSLHAHHDTVHVADGEITTIVPHYPFAEFDVFVNDLDFYPVAGVLKENLFQECYVLVDSLVNGVLDTDQDTIWYTVEGGPDYVQDSARVFTKVVSDTNRLWADNFACHNYTFAYQPWSLGVATLDGVDENGRPYEFGNESAHGVADYLTSRPINLGGESSVYLTFLYQAEGFGNMPEEIDSLILDLWDESDQIWHNAVWFSLGDIEPDVWDTAYFPIPGSFVEDGFRFRLRNYASLSGALDHWHIDYVSLDADGLPIPDNFRDLAISYPVVTLLEDYTSVPWDHYVATSGSEKMLEKSDLFVYNSDATPTIFANGQLAIRKDGTLEGGSPFAISSTGVPEPNYLLGLNECLFDVGSDYFYDQGAGGLQATFDVQVNIATSGSNKHRDNDTSKFAQKFKNYYAYDDGSAEAAYGIEGVGSLLAYKFEAYQAGALTGILMQFVPSVTDVSDEVFLLTVWSDDGGEPGDIIYQDDFFESHSPEYSGSKEGFKYYEFKNSDYVFYEDIYKPADEPADITVNEALLNVGEVFYVGWQKINSQSLNIGLDWNRNNGDKVFRNTAGSWASSSFDISLLIRPVFSTGLNYTLSDGDEVNEEDEVVWQEALDVVLYPNPANSQFTLDGLPEDFILTVYDMSGRGVITAENESDIDISFLENGVYIVDIRSHSGENIYTTKLIKK